MIKIKSIDGDKEEYILNEADFVLIHALRDLTESINKLARKLEGFKK